MPEGRTLRVTLYGRATVSCGTAFMPATKRARSADAGSSGGWRNKRYFRHSGGYLLLLYSLNFGCRGPAAFGRLCSACAITGMFIFIADIFLFFSLPSGLAAALLVHYLAAWVCRDGFCLSPSAACAAGTSRSPCVTLPCSFTSHEPVPCLPILRCLDTIIAALLQPFFFYILPLITTYPPTLPIPLLSF